MCLIAIVYHSKSGHTQLQAEAVLRGVQSIPKVKGVIYRTEKAIGCLDELDEMDGIIFGCPTYCGSISAGMKTFLEAATAKWSMRAWKDKVAGAFTSGSSFSGEKLNTLVGLMINAMQNGMIYVGQGTMPADNEQASLEQSSGPSAKSHNRVGSALGPMATTFHMEAPDTPCQGDLETAEAYGCRVAEITQLLTSGKLLAKSNTIIHS